MTAFDRRLDALDARLPLAEEIEALVQRIVVEEGLTAGEAERLRADARDLQRRYRGLSVDEMLDAIVAEEGLTAEETDALLATAARYAEMAP